MLRLQPPCLLALLSVAGAGCGGGKPPLPPLPVPLPPASEPIEITESGESPLHGEWQSSGPLDWEVAEHLGKLAVTAYLSPGKARDQFGRLGYDSIVDNIEGSMVCYLVSNSHSLVVVFRGTDDLEDWLANLKIHQTDVSGGTLHAGFSEAYISLEPKIVAALQQNQGKSLWITGHSLGGALAVVCSYHLMQQARPLVGLVTFGQPMVMDGMLAGRFQSQVESRYTRFINGADVVTRVPPPFVHCGATVWFDQGQVKRSRPQVKKRAAPALPPPPPFDEKQFRALQAKLKEMRSKGPKSGPPKRGGLGLPMIDDHSMDRYLRLLSAGGTQVSPLERPSLPPKNAPLPVRPPRPPKKGLPRPPFPSR